jgi:phage protein D
MIKQRYAAPAAFTALAAGTIVRRVRKQHQEQARTHGFRRLGRRLHRTESATRKGR